jgi:2-keto-3-deoxy-L-rhamnonate aldolase RhmA
VRIVVPKRDTATDYRTVATTSIAREIETLAAPIRSAHIRPEQQHIHQTINVKVCKMFRTNKVKQAMREGKVVKGLIHYIPHPDIVEMLAAAGWDFVQFEGEHEISVCEAKPLVLAADATGITPFVKVGLCDPVLIANWLDLGVQAVKINHIQTMRDAERAVKACKYAPEGDRSWCMGARSAGHCTQPNFAGKANEEIMVILGIEDIQGLANLESIASVPGVDVITVGPGDMSANLGVPGQYDHPKVRDAFIRMINTCKANGVTPGVMAIDYKEAKFYVGQGAQYIVFSSDKRMMNKVFQETRRELDKLLEC